MSTNDLDFFAPADSLPADEAPSTRSLKIAILSRKASLYSTRRLKEAGERRGHKVQVIDYLRCYMNITSHRPTVVYSGRELNDVDAVIPRIGASHTFYGTAVVRQFEMMGIFSANESQAITRSRDKLRCLQLLSREGVGLPVTGFAHSTKDIGGLIDIVGGAPLVVKIVEGTQGVGVILAETRKAAEAVIEAFRGVDANILVQQFIKEASGSDIRCFVVDGKVVASMMRTAKEGEFRSNLHRGGTASYVEISQQETQTALQAANLLGLRVAGVDILRSNNGPVVMEVNSSPGLEGIEKATEIDVAERVIHFIEQNVGVTDSKDRIKG
ncbi:30S ribosomal protein S6--L-glutamate ligase [Planctomicrobium sp. SH668]|uniref:30S ribosomal protein S6--L-glutamate ligase n=1 Tax=Planctomicrobium sp. SH668 TaxID=3448126 RepID=UPI003F5C3A61